MYFIILIGTLENKNIYFILYNENVFYKYYNFDLKCINIKILIIIK